MQVPLLNSLFSPAAKQARGAPRACRSRRGISMIELLVGLVLALLTGAALVQLQLAHYTAFSVVSGQNFVNANTRQPLDVISDTLRNAQSVQNGAAYQALVAASASDVVCFADNGSTVEIFLDTSTTPSTLRRVKKDASGTVIANETLVQGLQSLQITYYTPAASAYIADAGAWTASADPNADLPNIGAARIRATVTVSGETRTLESFVRLRNSPYTHEM